jgi:AI-2 transport system ATP-binding protein
MGDETRQLAIIAQIASQYYEQGKTQPEIAAGLGISVDEVGQILDEAREKRVVEVIVHHPLETVSELEKTLVSTFNLKAARVLRRDNSPYEEMLAGLGELAADYFSAVLTEKSVIGISWGSALYRMIQAIRPMNMPNVEVVQLIGATGGENVIVDGPILARLLANRLGAVCHYLHSPLIVDSEVARDTLLQERSIRQAMQRAEHANIALVGIGSTDSDIYSLLKTGYVSREELEQIRAGGAIGDICAQHFSESGDWLNIDINRRVVGVTLDTLAKIDTVIAVAGGERKAHSILAALTKQYVNVLVTDEQAARAVLKLHVEDAGEVKGETAVLAERRSKKPLVSLKSIWKVFAGVPVLKGVDIELKAGEIHALLGGNGSGKSTLMKILSGVYTADAGTIELEGSPVTIHNPSHAHELGIYLVPQEPEIFPHLTVEENILLGSDLQSTEARERIKRFAADLSFEGDLSEPAGRLSIASQQLLEIIRGLIRQAKVLILDEPTSTLTSREVDSLFARLRKLSARGIGIFFISHRLGEVLAISQHISVLRDGDFVLSEATKSLTTRDLVRAMLPDEAESNGDSAKARHELPRLGEAVLEVTGLAGETFKNISFQVRSGEIVGLTGLVGAGRTELANAILGTDPETSGQVRICGQEAKVRNVRRCQELGLVYVPEDRHAHGIFLDLPNLQTTTAAILPKLGRFLISARQERTIANNYVKQLQIRISGLTQLARTLSGGNQQKVVLSKTLASHPRVIIMDEPTRGVDAQARQDVYHIIHELTSQQVGVLLISSDLEEVAQLSDRVLVMYQGRIVEELSHSECQIERITTACFGLKGEL